MKSDIATFTNPDDAWVAILIGRCFVQINCAQTL